jgi:hypothetical protein
MRTFQPQGMELDRDNPFSGILAATKFDFRFTLHTTVKATPS